MGSSWLFGGASRVFTLVQEAVDPDDRDVGREYDVGLAKTSDYAAEPLDVTEEAIDLVPALAETRIVVAPFLSHLLAWDDRIAQPGDGAIGPAMLPS